MISFTKYMWKAVIDARAFCITNTFIIFIAYTIILYPTEKGSLLESLLFSLSFSQNPSEYIGNTSEGLNQINISKLIANRSRIESGSRTEFRFSNTQSGTSIRFDSISTCRYLDTGTNRWTREEHEYCLVFASSSEGRGSSHSHVSSTTS